MRTKKGRPPTFTPSQSIAIRLASGCLQCQEPSCSGGCPIGVGVPSVLSLASSGRVEDAASLMRHRNPLASVTGRLCPSDRFCEHACILARKGSPLPIRSLERHLGDTSLALPLKKGRTARGKVLVIGSGPAGLTAAHDLHAEGFTVTVYERGPRLGGWLRRLPAKILPPRILDSEIDRLTMGGIAFETCRPFQAEDGLPPKGFCAMVLATGAPDPASMPLPLKRGPEGYLSIDAHHRTSMLCIYAAGGAIAHLGSITEAMASARETAGHILRDHLFPPESLRKGLI